MEGAGRDAVVKRYVIIRAVFHTRRRRGVTTRRFSFLRRNYYRRYKNDDERNRTFLSLFSTFLSRVTL